MSKITIIEILKQYIGIEDIQSPNVAITTTRVETMVAPNMNVITGGVLTRYATNLGSGSSGVSVGRNLIGVRHYQ
jgi:hypothetical protein